MLCVIGDVQPEDVCALAREVLGDEAKEVGHKLRPWREDLSCPVQTTHESMDVAMPMFSLAFKGEPLGKGAEAIRREMAADLAAEALFGESSELYLRLYEEGIIDSSFGGGFETVDGAAMLMCSGDSLQPEALRTALIAQAQRLVTEGIDETAFVRMKRSALGRRIRELDSFDSTCFRLCAYSMSDFDYFRFPGIYRQIEKADVEEFLRQTVQADRCALSVIEPLTQ